MEFFGRLKRINRETPPVQPNTLPGNAPNELVLFDGEENPPPVEATNEPGVQDGVPVPEHTPLRDTNEAQPSLVHDEYRVIDATPDASQPQSENPLPIDLGTPKEEPQLGTPENPLPPNWNLSYWGRESELEINFAQALIERHRKREGLPEDNIIPDTPSSLYDSFATSLSESLRALTADMAGMQKQFDDPQTSPDQKAALQKAYLTLKNEAEKIEGRLLILKKQGFIPLSPSMTPEAIKFSLDVLQGEVAESEDTGVHIDRERHERTIALLKKLYEPYALKKELLDIEHEIESHVRQRREKGVELPQATFGLAQRKQEILERLKELEAKPG
ncbi:MAG TPA: hypothetical protein PK609_03810 [Candidatus Paceibacterota bacterium]|nr:hypothetical protein [Candidatus Paceibacterota bacterium]